MTSTFKPSMYDDYHYTDPTSRWHTDALKTTKRLQRVGDKLQYRITIDDWNSSNARGRRTSN